MASRTQRGRVETLLPYEKREKEANINRDIAATALTDAQRNRVVSLVEHEKNQILANINRDNAAAGLSAANQKRIEDTAPLEVQELQKKINQYVEVEMKGPEGTSQKGNVTMAQLMNEINDSRNKIAQRHKDHEAAKRLARSDTLKELDAATKAETTIKTRLLGGKTAIKDDRELGPDVDMFHATSKSPYLYILEQTPGVVGSTPKYKQRDLPTVDGHRYTAQEIYDAADARSMTVQQYMEQVFYPSLKQPVPWLAGDTSSIKPVVPAGASPSRKTD